MKNGVNWKMVVNGLSIVVISMIAAYFGPEVIHDNDSAINVIVTVFSILAGFLVAIIAIVGDPVLLPPGTWRAAEMEYKKTCKRLYRHGVLFFLYLVTLALIFFSLLIGKKFPQVGLWIDRIFIFFGTVTFICSFFIPASLMKIQKERIDSVIEHRRKNSQI